MESSDNAGGVGGRIGSRVADQTSRAIAVTAQRLAPHKKKLAMSIMDELFRIMDSEAQAALGPWLAKIAKDPDLPPALKPLMSAVSDPHGQWQMFIAGSTTGAVMGGGLGALLTNEMNPVILRLIGENPNNILSPETAASMEARGIKSIFSKLDEAHSGGINTDRFGALVESARSYPTAGETIDLLNRGVVDHATAVFWLGRNAIREDVAEDIIRARHQLLSPDRLAQLVTFGVLDENEAARIAEQSGMMRDDFHRLVLGNGEPPGVQDLLLAWRRGVINESDVERGITQGPLRNEWIPVVKSLQWQPLSVGEAADAVNQGHLTLDEGRKIALENGFKPDLFDIVIKNAGIPPGPQTALDWLNRGLITEQQALSMLYESRIKNEWVPTYLQSRQHLMPASEVRMLLARGAITSDVAMTKLAKLGISEEDAAYYVDGATRERTAAHRELTVTEVLELNQSGALSDVDSATMLTAFGFSESDTQWILLIPQLRRMKALQAAAINRIGRSYLIGIIDVNDASAAMDRLAIPAEQRDLTISLWDEQRLTPTRSLTPAEIGTAVSRGLLTEDEGVTRLVGYGFSEIDARIRLELSQPRSKKP